jgi:hypothetical protein
MAHMKVNRIRSVVVAFAAVTLAAVLTGCQGGGTAAGSDAGAGAGKGAGKGAGASTAAASPSGTGTGAAGAGAGAASSPGVSAKPAGSGKSTVPAASTSPAAGCSDEPPTPDEVDPDEFALYRIEELDGSTGKVNLVIQHGAWGCPGKDTDGAPFVVTGEESRWAMDQAAYVTATNPITDSAENQRIGVQELIDWVNAHPDSGLVFRYETGDDGAIHRLEQVFTP